MHKRIIKFKPEEADRIWMLSVTIRNIFKNSKEDFINFNFNNFVIKEDTEFFRVKFPDYSLISWYKNRFIISYDEDCILCENKNVCIEQ